MQRGAGRERGTDVVGDHAPAAGQMLEARDAERFRRAAHSLKSNAQTFGARRLADAARALELGGIPSDSAPLDALEAELAVGLAALAERAGG